MAFDYVVTFGDSWPDGAELMPGEQPYGKLIADYYQCEFINLAESATSIDHMILQLNSLLEKSLTGSICAVFFLTDIARSIYWNTHGQAEELQWRNTNYLKHLYSDQLSNFRANQALLSLQRMCEKYQLKDFYVVGWTKFPITLKGIDLNKLYQSGNKTCVNMFNDTGIDPMEYFKPSISHPNQLGHQQIAKTLIQWIDQYEN